MPLCCAILINIAATSSGVLDSSIPLSDSCIHQRVSGLEGDTDTSKSEERTSLKVISNLQSSVMTTSSVLWDIPDTFVRMRPLSSRPNAYMKYSVPGIRFSMTAAANVPVLVKSLKENDSPILL